MKAWEKLKVGDKVSFKYNDLGECGIAHCEITDKNYERAIATTKGMDLWVDESTQQMFIRGWI